MQKLLTCALVFAASADALPATPAVLAFHDQVAQAVTQKVAEAGGAAPPHVAPFSGAIAAQRTSIAADARAKQQAEDVRSFKRRMDETTLRVFQQLYYSAKAAGIQMADPTPVLNSVNDARRNTGVWTVQVTGANDQGMLLTVVDFGEPGLVFNVEGIGLIASNQRVDDPNWPPLEDKPLTPGCQYKVSIGFGWRSYACAPLASGALDAKVLADMQAMLSRAIQEAAKGRAERRD